MTQQTPAVNSASSRSTWPGLARLLARALVLFVLLNLLFAALYPMEALGRLTLYNWLLPGRQRLPYGEVPQRAYNLSLNNIPAMLNSHQLARPKAADEFRVVLIGDSGTWGWLLDNDQTVAGQLNAAGLRAAGGRRIVVYNLGYPILSLAKDLVLLDAALAYQPDLILWKVTLHSFEPAGQLEHPLLQHNPARLRRLIAAYDLNLDPADPRFVEPNFLQRTFVGQRRPLADLLRLQSYGFAWAATGVDQDVPEEIALRQSDFEADLSWAGYETPRPLTADMLALDLLSAGVALAGETPVLVVNEPIFISQGRNSDQRYNAWYPRWAYDGYRPLLAEAALAAEAHYLDLWELVPPEAFTDSPVHLSPDGVAELARALAPAILALAD